MLMWNWTVEN